MFEQTNERWKEELWPYPNPRESEGEVMALDALQAHVDDLIDEWHEGAGYTGQTLRDYLNMTEQQYGRLVENRGFSDDYIPPPLGRTWGDDPDEVDISRAIGQPGPIGPMAEFILLLMGLGCALALLAWAYKYWEGR